MKPRNTTAERRKAAFAIAAALAQIPTGKEQRDARHDQQHDDYRDVANARAQAGLADLHALGNGPGSADFKLHQLAVEGCGGDGERHVGQLRQAAGPFRAGVERHRRNPLRLDGLKARDIQSGFGEQHGPVELRRRGRFFGLQLRRHSVKLAQASAGICDHVDHAGDEQRRIARTGIHTAIGHQRARALAIAEEHGRPEAKFAIQLAPAGCRFVVGQIAHWGVVAGDPRERIGRIPLVAEAHNDFTSAVAQGRGTFFRAGQAHVCGIGRDGNHRNHQYDDAAEQHPCGA